VTAEALHARWSPDAGEHEHVVFLVEGMHCAGCARSIDKAVRALPDVLGVRVNNATARVSVEWRGRGATGLPQILGAVTRAGFRPLPLAGASATAEFQRGRRAALKRLGLASLGMMQAMMYLSALYGISDIDATMAQLMRVTGMIITTPVLFYSGAPFLAGAWRDLTHRRLGMDVPVALALLLAWLPSVVNTLLGSGEVYFDSVGMFIFFLSAGRFVEMNVRHRSLSSTEALARSLPSQVTRLLDDDRREKITAAELAVGDRFIVAKGAVVAVDAQLDPDGLETHVSLDESLITGESAAVSRGQDERIRGGSVNLGAPVILRAVAVVADSTLASMVKLLERAQATRPPIARAADRAATWFVAVILLLAAITALAWWRVDPARAFPAVLAVLVVTCPCALSLATPAVLAAATTRLARLGLLVTRADAIERLARVDTVIFDKTGTLTGNAAGVLDVKLLGSLSRGQALATAAALERGSSHPLAEAFRPFDEPGLAAVALQEFEAHGVQGTIDGVTWRLGRRRFVEELSSARRDPQRLVPLHARGTQLYLGSSQGLAAEIDVGVPLRADARQAIDRLRRLGLEVIIASGDSAAAVASAARTLEIRRSHSRLGPDDKIRLVDELRADLHRVFVVGDGINDGPVLAAADVSCAMGQGSAIAQSASDLLLVHDGLAILPRAIETAREALRVMRQNLAWALAYNIAAVPLAALGWVPPWLAALGMSLSSLGVVLNARRLAGRA
jgi:Cu2+-exporting ATPase